MAGVRGLATAARIATAQAMMQLSTQMATQAANVSPSATPAQVLQATQTAAVNVSLQIAQGIL